MSAPLTATEANTARRRGLTLIAAAVALAAVGWGGWHWFAARHFETTDNAYVAGNVVQITPQMGGTVVAIQAEDTQRVQVPWESSSLTSDFCFKAGPQGACRG